MHDCIFRIENKGQRAFQYKIPQSDFSEKELNAYRKLNEAKIQIEMMALQGATRNSPCFCGSGEKYKTCHGKEIKKLIEKF